jgi:hypothetical protein
MSQNRQIHNAQTSFDNQSAMMAVQAQLDEMARKDMEKSNSRERLLGNVIGH